MIKNKKQTSRFMSVLSAVIAVIMLSTTVFADVQQIADSFEIIDAVNAENLSTKEMK